MKNSIIALILSSGIASAATIQIDIGNNTLGYETSVTGWNNMSGATGTNPGNLTNMVNSAGDPTIIDLTYSESALDGGVSGVAPGAEYNGAYPALIAGMPVSALRDGVFYRNGNTATLSLSDLDPNLSYNFVLYGARGNNGGDAIYTATGSNSAFGSISNVLNNSTEVVSLLGITPTAGGVIDVVLSQGATPAGAASINMMTVTSVPEPSAFALLGLSGLALLRRRRR